MKILYFFAIMQFIIVYTLSNRSFCESEIINAHIPQENNKMVLELSSDQMCYHPHEAIIISVTAMNISDATIYASIAMSDYAKGYVFNVTNTIEETKTPFTKYGEKNYEQFFKLFSIRPGYSTVIDDTGQTTHRVPIVSFEKIYIAPKGSYTKNFTINRIYDMSTAGEYEISCLFNLREYIFKEQELESINNIPMKAKPITVTILDK